MTAVSLVSAAVPLMQQMFPPMSQADQLRHTPMLILAMVDFCMAAAYLALWRAAPDFRAFRSLGGFFAIVVVQQVLLYFGGFAPSWSARAIAGGILVETAAEAMRIPGHRWTRVFWPIYLAGSITAWIPSLNFTLGWPLLASEIPLAILIVLGFRNGNRRDRVITSAFAFYFFVRLTLDPMVNRLFGVREYFLLGGWQWYYTTVGLSLLGAVTLAVFVRDLVRDRSEKQRLAAELAASRAVQQFMIPMALPSIAGFAVESVYRPFGDVGGDFFQILPLPQGDALVVIGDVSGKGMPAAMTVSLVVGALSLAVEATTSPGEILSALNRALFGRKRDGFTTCLVVRAEAGGALTLANAGHIAPYLEGRELPLENGLPLGLTPSPAYAETTVNLEPGQRLMLLTDGVVEARGTSGELFGFEATAGLAGQPAAAIVAAAQAFGQEDDITVLSLTRTLVPVTAPI
jgi:hypothetical protein